MNFSFLFIESENEPVHNCFDGFQLDGKLKEFCVPLTNIENILYRQQTSKFFYENPSALNIIKDFCNNMELIESDYTSFKRTRNINKLNRWSVEVLKGASSILATLNIAAEYSLKCIRSLRNLISELKIYTLTKNTDKNAVVFFTRKIGNILNRREFYEIEGMLKKISSTILDISLPSFSPSKCSQ